ncbi:MAG: DsbA family protein [Undibacterium sp.]
MDWKATLTRWREDSRTLWSIIIVLLGLIAGSLFVDLGQIISGSGFSARALRSHDVVVAQGKTWVAYTEPKVGLQIISDATCAECDPSDALVWLRRIVPTLEAERVDIGSEKGKALAETFKLVTLPAFIFDAAVEKTEFYAQAEPLFRTDEKSGRSVFDMHTIGMPIGRYLVAPETGDGDITLGSKDAPVTLVVFSDFQCQHCKEYHATYKRILAEYPDRVRFVWKHLPLSIHQQAPMAAEAAQCAALQNQFLPYADILFGRQAEWGKIGGERRFKEYAWRVKGLDGRAFATCLDTHASAEKVTADTELAARFNLESTPATFINREFVSGALPYDDLKALIETELAK